MKIFDRVFPDTPWRHNVWWQYENSQYYVVVRFFNELCEYLNTITQNANIVSIKSFATQDEIVLVFYLNTNNQSSWQIKLIKEALSELNMDIDIDLDFQSMMGF